MKLKSLLASSILVTNLFAFDYNLKETKITDNVYCFIGKYEIPTKQNGGAMSNMCFIDEGKYYNTIDSGPSYKYAKQAHELIMKNHGKKPVKYVFVTHGHDDHFLGNDYFATKGASIVASKNFDDALASSHMKNLISGDAYEGTKFYGSDIQIKDSKQKFGNIKAFSLTDNAHSASDIVYIDEKNKVAFCGDLVFNGRIPALRDGSSVNGWLEALEKLKELKFDYISSGHGDITSTNAYENTKEYLLLLKEKVLEAIDEDIGIEEAAKSIKLEKFKNFPLYKELHSKNVFKAYQELEFE